MTGVRDPSEIARFSLDVRLAAPVYPGETVRTELWVDGDVVSLRASCVDRGVKVLDNGRAGVTPAR